MGGVASETAKTRLIVSSTKTGSRGHTLFVLLCYLYVKTIQYNTPTLYVTLRAEVYSLTIHG